MTVPVQPYAVRPGTPPGRGPRVFAISDLHVDYRANREWIDALPRTEHREDTLIVAGDVTHDLGLLDWTLFALRERFRHVAYMPGNHELWLRGGQWADSAEKLERILDLCASLDVHTTPLPVRDHSGSICAWVVPLLSWYAQPEHGEDSLFLPKPGEDPSLRAWADRYLVRWPESPRFADPSRILLERNEVHVARQYDAPVVSFSHFLPRRELIRRTPAEQVRHGGSGVDPHPQFNFSRVAGSAGIDRQLRRIGASVHVYGHQHRNRWRAVDGVLYVSNCLGYPGRDEHGGHTTRALWQVFGDT